MTRTYVAIRRDEEMNEGGFTKEWRSLWEVIGIGTSLLPQLLLRHSFLSKEEFAESLACAGEMV